MNDDAEPWNLLIIDVLLAIPQNATEQAYYGPYNTILTREFTLEDRFIVAPQTHPNSREAVDFLIEYLIMVDHRAVLIVEIKRENIFQYESSRIQADLQIQDRFFSLHNDSLLSETIGVSIFGRFCRVYRYTRETQTITSDSGNGIHPDRWNINLYTQQGRAQLANIFEQVRQRVAQELQ
ncbi:hypothetical protein CONCODRAFT_165663 [Conidiobolus coronatus NRRL 28638]|uniref:Uncharacterized protein n=1 Tax=Conidiobolus coronatus (strain ATCC 28846 / CBS 209.66 / NRRL 28638) TaxID=796925 RepID=A0A137P3L6_CONC2|nr:hypothetical protein CONCODRAFT_165663 [Conidiobolus coronatus NRRL 28638]|eukprot:KXN69588.1 hypothetical protein CONCODRAFT_165663 [Conidiobolus coronatus NRRL 28638]